MIEGVTMVLDVLSVYVCVYVTVCDVGVCRRVSSCVCVCVCAYVYVRMCMCMQAHFIHLLDAWEDGAYIN